MKLLALRLYYFKEPWNVFDFIIVVFSVLRKTVLSKQSNTIQDETSSSAMAERPRELDQRFQMGGQFEAIID